MKNNSTRKILLSTIAVTVFTILSGLVVNLMTASKSFNYWLAYMGFGTTSFIIILISLISIVLILTLWQNIYADKSEQESFSKAIESELGYFYDYLKVRYQKQYESKLYGRFEIALEVNENWNSDNPQTYKSNAEAKISPAIETVKKAFNKTGRLLIVGNPGSGKTVLLLNLALQLLGNKYKANQKIPIIFNLASWSEDYENFEDWLVKILDSENGLTKGFARKLLFDNRIILLFDGLDKVAINEDTKTAHYKRAKCLNALNNYLREGRQSVICCRREEFAKMQKITNQDAPVSAKIEILDLTESDILSTLNQAQKDLNTQVAAKHLLRLIDDNKVFLKVLRTPQILTMALISLNKQIIPNNEYNAEKLLIEKFLNDISHQKLEISEISKINANLEDLLKLENTKVLDNIEISTSTKHSNSQPQNLKTQEILKKYEHLTCHDDNRRTGDILNGKYKLEGYIGAGGMGWVYLGSSITKNEIYAIKLMKPEVVARNPRNIKLFEREVQAARKLNHPNIVKVFDSGTDENHRISYLVMEILDGITVENFINNKRMPLNLMRKIFCEICEAINYAHKQNILHLDLKPLNIMLLKKEVDDYDAKVIDFGMSRVISSESGTTVTQFGGSHVYCSPEHYGGKLTYRSDIYSLGAILYFLLTGVTPFSAGSYINAKINPNLDLPPLPSLLNQVSTLPKELDYIIEKAMQKDPLKRHDTVGNLLTEFEDISDKLQ